MKTPYNADIYDTYTRMSWKERQEANTRSYWRDCWLEDKAEYEAEKRRDDELTGDAR